MLTPSSPALERGDDLKPQAVELATQFFHASLGKRGANKVTVDRVRVPTAGSEKLIQRDGIALIQDNGIGASFEIDL